MRRSPDEDLKRLIADTLSCAPDRAAPLAQLVHEKTGGNPFFAIQFISALAEEGLLRFDHDTARWCWDLERHSRQGLHRQCGGAYGREVDAPARRDPGCAAAARLPRQRRRNRDAFDRSREIERGGPIRLSGTPSAWSWSSTWRAPTSSSTTVSRRPPIHSYRNVARRGAPPDRQAARGAHACGKTRRGHLRDRQSAQPRRRLDHVRRRA